MMNRNTRALPFAIAALSFLAAACGDDDTGTPEDMGTPVDLFTPSDMPRPPEDMGAPPVGECTAELMGSTIGEACARDRDCSDACFCNGVELCMAGVCVAGQEPCGATDCSSGTCDESTNTCDETPDDSLCDDGVFCNGVERCDPVAGCLPGTPPFCSDGDICTVDFCDEETTTCGHEVLDLDMDGAPAVSCGGSDCDDTTGLRSPSNTEICDNGIDDDCNLRVDVFDPACEGTNDVCSDADGRGPRDITRTTDGTTTVSASTFGLAGDYNVSCTSSTTREGGPDAVFTFSLTETKDVAVEVQGLGPDAVVEIRPFSSCDTESGNVACSAPTSLQPYAFARSVPPGDYAAIVITEEPVGFTLAYTMAPPTTGIVVGDRCDTAIDISAGGTFAGDFDGDPRFSGDEFSDQYELTCRSTTTAYPEVAFTFTVPAGASRDVQLSGFSNASTGSGRRPYLSLVDSCTAPSASVRFCEESPANGDPAQIALRDLGPGTYFVLLEADFTSDRSWSLQANIAPATGGAPGDSCFVGNPVSITAGPATVDLADMRATPNEGAFCRANGGGSRDVFFTFDVATESDVTLTTTSSGVRHTAAVASACGVVPSALACTGSSSGTSTRTYGRLSPGTYFVNLTTLEATGTVTAEISTATPASPPSNDTCAAATTIAPSTTTFIDLTSHTDTTSGCGTTGRRDAFYTFTLATDQEVTLQAPNAQGLRLLSSSCTGSETCSSGSPPVITGTLTAGTYYVAVEAEPLAARPDIQLFFTSTDP